MATVIDPHRATRFVANPDRIVLHDIPWETYTALRDVESNDHVRMAYHNGVLELMSPQFRHDRSAAHFEWLVMAVAEACAVPCTCARTTTFRRKLGGPLRGAGREADTSFYFANEPAIRDKADIDLAIDPPPDLAIEVDHTTSSEWKLPIYADLGVPEVWLYDAVERSLVFKKLQQNGSYINIDRSMALPMLTPQLVLEALGLALGLPDTQWLQRVREWAEGLQP